MLSKARAAMDIIRIALRVMVDPAQRRKYKLIKHKTNSCTCIYNNNIII